VPEENTLDILQYTFKSVQKPLDQMNFDSLQQEFSRRLEKLQPQLRTYLKRAKADLL